MEKYFKLKWAGGKQKLLSKILPLMPLKNTVETYYEPFLGGGSIFLNVSYKKCVVSDLNSDLINFYKCISDNLNEVVSEFKKLPSKTEEDYYYVRSIERNDDYLNKSKHFKAARFLYLNKNCFNGLYRINPKGYFNVPWNKAFWNIDTGLKNIENTIIKFKNVDIKCDSFVNVVPDKNDFIYLDPPYVNTFNAYNKDNFNSMHDKILEYCIDLDNNGIRFMMSNSDDEWVLENFKNFNIEYLICSRGLKNKNKPKVREVLITNYENENIQNLNNLINW